MSTISVLCLCLYYACTRSTMPVLCLLSLYYVCYACTMSTLPQLCLYNACIMSTMPVLCLYYRYVYYACTMLVLSLYYVYYACTMSTISVLYLLCLYYACSVYYACTCVPCLFFITTDTLSLEQDVATVKDGLTISSERFWPCQPSYIP